MSNEETKSIVENNGKAEWVSDAADDDTNDVEAKEREPLQPNARQKQSNAANKEVCTHSIQIHLNIN